MKTTKELYFKWQGEQCICHRDCHCKSLNEYGLNEAIQEHDNEIIELIDEMIEGDNGYRETHRIRTEALTELKNRLAYCKQVGE